MVFAQQGKYLKVGFLSISQDHHSRLKTITLAPYVLKSYVDEQCKRDNIKTVQTIVKDYYWYDDIDGIVNDVVSEQCGLLCLSVYTWNAKLLFLCARRIKKESPNTIIALGGPEVSPLAEEVLRMNPFADIVSHSVRGGEIIVYDLVKAVLNHTPLHTVKGIYGRMNKLVYKTPCLEQRLDLGSVSSPYCNGTIRFQKGVNYIPTIETMRGCVNNCGYCFWGLGKGIEYQPIDKVLKEIDFLYNNKCVKEVEFADSNLFTNNERAKRILERIVRAGRKDVISYFEISSKVLTPELIKLAGQLPNFQFILSPQSTNKGVLKLISEKRDTPESIESAIKLIRTLVADARITFSLILGLPGETLDTFRESIRWCLMHKPSKINIAFPLYLLPGSTFWERRVEFGLLHSKPPAAAVYATKDFPAIDMEKAVRLSWWTQLFICYIPALRQRIYEFEKMVEVIEEWGQVVNRELKLIYDNERLSRMATISVKSWNEKKRGFLTDACSPDNIKRIFQIVGVDPGDGLLTQFTNVDLKTPKKSQLV